LNKLTLNPSMRRRIVLFSFLSPALLIYTVFLIYPIWEAIRISFYDWNGSGKAEKYVGMGNYVKTLKDSVFVQALQHNVIWMIADLILMVVPILVLAVLISRVRKGMMFFRAGFYLPAVLSLPVISVLWGKIYDPLIGPINTVLNAVGLDFLAFNWLGDHRTVLFSLIIVGVWAYYGLYMILFLAGLQSIDYSLYESAEIDGAGAFRKFWNITLPSMRNTMNVVLSMVIIYGFKSFGLVWIMTLGGPFYKSELVATYVYKAAFTMNKVGYGSAGAVILMIIVVTITVIFNATRERKEV
jgi:raffinose/stachyose/melibiose transport system permease protein